MNFVDRDKPAKSQYKSPEIRVDKIFETDFSDLMVNNKTVKSLEGQFGLEFLYSQIISVKGKKFMWAIDNYGFVNYFFTRNFKHFAFTQRSYSGGLFNSTSGDEKSSSENMVVTDV